MIAPIESHVAGAFSTISSVRSNPFAARGNSVERGFIEDLRSRKPSPGDSREFVPPKNDSRIDARELLDRLARFSDSRRVGAEEPTTPGVAPPSRANDATEGTHLSAGESTRVTASFETPSSARLAAGSARQTRGEPAAPPVGDATGSDSRLDDNRDYDSTVERVAPNPYAGGDVESQFSVLA